MRGIGNQCNSHETWIQAEVEFLYGRIEATGYPSWEYICSYVCLYLCTCLSKTIIGATDHIEAQDVGSTTCYQYKCTTRGRIVARLLDRGA